MQSSLQNWGLQEWSAVFSIGTPIVLLFWFYRSQKELFSTNLYEDIKGNFAGFIKAQTKPFFKGGSIHAGVILSIKVIGGEGYFRGEIEFKEEETVFEKDLLTTHFHYSGTYSFFGDVDFEMYPDEKRNPFNLGENRQYRGRIFLIGRQDVNIETYDITKNLIAEYNLRYFREIGILKLNLLKEYGEARSVPLPSEMTLYKSFGFTFEPYYSISTSLFKNQRH